MAINLTDSIRVGQQKPVDDKYFNGLVPYKSTTEANNLIKWEVRHRGLTVNINGEEYWYKDGIKDANLVLKVPNLDTKLDKGTYIGTAQDLKNSIDSKANTDASNIDDNLHIWRQKIDANYVHDQAQPSSIWTINHPLNKKVSVTIIDTAGTVIEGEVIINNGSQVTITFNAPFSGIAVLN